MPSLEIHQGALSGVTPILLVATSGLLLWLLVDYIRVLRLRRTLPPGPIPLPLFGNYFQTPRLRPWVDWEQWSKDYNSPMITIWNGHRPSIIINDAWAISDLFDKRADIYSSRPHMYAMGDMIGATETNQVCLVYGDQWRLHRRLMHTAVGSQAVKAHRPFQGDEAKVLALDLLQRPDDFVKAIERYACSVVSIIGWGQRIEDTNHPTAQVALAMMEGVDLVVPCWHIVEVIPALLRVPSWLYAARERVKQGSEMGVDFFGRLTREAGGKGKANFAERVMRSHTEKGINEAEVASLTGNLIGGGVDTTSGSLITFVLAMCVFPEAQRRAQEELDRVVGRGRSPGWQDDERSLPYVAALRTEVLRWRTVAILGGIPHAPTRDDEYGGYFIPRGTPVHGNVWAIHRNAREFPAPDSFRPERFLGGLERPYPNKQGHSAFGWGRRVCSGQPLAEQGLFMTIARLLWAFDVQPGVDDKGDLATLDIFKYTNSENMRPEPFPARFTPRTPEIADMIRKEAEEAKEALSIYA